MEYTLNTIKINSNWFDDVKDKKESTYNKIGYKGLNLYFQLYKFRLHRQDNEHTFITSISLLRKETGYKTDEIFELLKKLKSAKIIKIVNVSRWDYLIDPATNRVKDKDILHVEALDTFPVEDYKQEEGRYYIYVPLDLFQQYKDKGLNEKYYALYCLIKKWSQNKEDKMYMSIEKMAITLGFDKDYLNKMIHNLNKNYFLSSYRRKRASGHGVHFDHYILDSVKELDVKKFMESHVKNMDRYLSKIEEVEADTTVTVKDTTELDFEDIDIAKLDFDEWVDGLPF